LPRSSAVEGFAPNLLQLSLTTSPLITFWLSIQLSIRLRGSKFTLFRRLPNASGLFQANRCCGLYETIMAYVFMCSNATVWDNVTVKTAMLLLTVPSLEAEAVTIATPSLHVSVAVMFSPRNRRRSPPLPPLRPRTATSR